MENNSIQERLYDFLNNYDLIQADIGKDEVIGLLTKALDNLGEGEEVLTCFIASAPSGESKSFAVTNSNRIVITGENSETSSIEIENLKTVRNGEGENEKKVYIESEGENLELDTLTPEGAFNINDALYIASNEILPEERIVEIFGAEPEVEEEIIEPEESTVPLEEVITPEAEEAEVIQEDEITPPIAEPEENKTAETEPEENETTEKEVSSKSVKKKPTESIESRTRRKVDINKPLLYILGALAAIVIGFGGVNIFNYMTSHMAAQSAANSYVDLFNQVDDIYNTAQQYANAGAGKSTPEQWNELDKKAKEIETKIGETEQNDLTNNLSDAIYYYDEAMITAINHGKNYAASSNAFDKNSLTRNLDQANLNRSAVLGFINSDFPDLIEKVNNSDDNSQAVYSNDDKVDQLIQEAESKPSDEAAKQNSKGS